MNVMLDILLKKVNDQSQKRENKMKNESKKMKEEDILRVLNQEVSDRTTSYKPFNVQEEWADTLEDKYASICSYAVSIGRDTSTRSQLSMNNHKHYFILKLTKMVKKSSWEIVLSSSK